MLTDAAAKEGLSESRRLEFDVLYAQHRRDYGNVTIIGLMLGLLGFDRFCVGHVGVGFAKLFTFGGLGVWAFVDLFLIRSAAAEVNASAAREIAASLTS